MCYGCGLCCGEVRNLRISDADIERGMLHVRQGKGGKARVLPLGRMLCRGIKDYLVAEKRKHFYLKDIMVKPFPNAQLKYKLTFHAIF